MLSIRDISIKNKLILMQVFTSVLVLSLCFGAFVITDIKGYKERKVNSTISIAQVIGSNSISALQFLDNEAAAKILFDLQKVEPDVINASIIDIKGKEFASYTKPGNKAHAFSKPFRDSYHFDDRYLYVYKGITDNKDAFGTVCLQVELTQLEEIKVQKFQIAFILLIVGIVLAFLIAIANQRYISAPLLYLIKVIKQIRQSNDYSKHVDVQGKDEISTLSLEFNNLMDEVAKSNQKKDEFIGIASHELKTPLTSVKLYLETLSKMPHEPLVKTFVEKARTGVSKLQGLILDLLDVSKIESGQLHLNKKEVDIDVLVDECIQDIKISSSHTIKREGETSGGSVIADRDRLEQVITNFISNAIKYSPTEKEIIVKTSSTDLGAVVSVSDSGIGIAPEEQAKVFERFYRAKESNTVISGFGLGLYICSEIIKRHNGVIGVDSEEGKGSTFYFVLPYKD